MLRRLLLLPLLSPLLAVLLIAAINPRPWVSVRVLTWTSPTWPLGGWIATAAALGGALSSAGAALALQGPGPGVIPERQVRRRAAGSESESTAAGPEPWGDWRERSTAAPGSTERSWAGPSRSPQEPAPTVSVPFRVIRKGSAASEAVSSPPSTAAPATNNDDWNTADSEDW